MAGSPLKCASANSILCHLHVCLADNTLKNILKSVVKLELNHRNRERAQRVKRLVKRLIVFKGLWEA